MKVVLATDRSEMAIEAARFLEALRFRAPIDLKIVSAMGDPYASNPDSMDHWFPELLEKEKIMFHQHHEKLRQMLSQRCRSIDAVAHSGHPVKVILAEADQSDADLIVIGARGHSAIGRLLIGSVSDSVATHAKCSVLVVRPRPADSAGDSASNHLTIGYDRSAASRMAVEEMVRCDWDESTRLTMISVAPIYDYLLGTGLSESVIANEEAFFTAMKKAGAEVQEEIAPAFPNTDIVVKQDQRVGDALVDTAQDKHSDLIVVGDSGHSMLDEFLLGSTTKFVLRHAKCSVWISRHHRQPAGQAAAKSGAASTGEH